MQMYISRGHSGLGDLVQHEGVYDWGAQKAHLQGHD